MYTRAVLLAVTMLFLCTIACAMCGTCGSGPAGKTEGKGMFSQVADEAVVKDEVKEITYDQFMSIRNSGEKYVLLDVLSQGSYRKGHIEGAVSFPLDSINARAAEANLSKDDHIIVYCGSFQCSASTEAARKLSKLGYAVLDYKGGIKEWQGKGNRLVSSNR